MLACDTQYMICALLKLSIWITSCELSSSKVDIDEELAVQPSITILVTIGERLVSASPVLLGFPHVLQLTAFHRRRPHARRVQRR